MADLQSDRNYAQRREDRAERLRRAGEEMFKVMIWTGCTHRDPRHPRNDGCPYCARRGRAMDSWDAALIGSPAFHGEEAK